MEVLENSMDNLASTVTNNKILTATNAKLIYTNGTFSASGISAKPPGSSGARNPNHTLHQKICKKWAIGGFCLTHGWKVLASHDRKTFPDANRKPGHNESAMRKNLKVPSSKSKKGWDAWVFGH